MRQSGFLAEVLMQAGSVEQLGHPGATHKPIIQQVSLSHYCQPHKIRFQTSMHGATPSMLSSDKHTCNTASTVSWNF